VSERRRKQQREPRPRSVAALEGIDVLVDTFADRLADRIVDRLQADDLPGYVDQSASPLGPRRHIRAIRSGRVPGRKVGRRYLARKEDLDAYFAKLAEPDATDAESADAQVVRDLGLRVVPGRRG